jgi:predicted AlkP superfamily pyrophosphatase or phosphodiesterase
MPARLVRLLLTVSLVHGCLLSTAISAPKQDHCVILVSVDGLAGFYLDDPKADLPTLRRMATEGARASGMLCSFPTVTWPNHTTLVTGVPPARHGVIGNNYFDRSTGKNVALIPDPVFDKDQIVKVPTIYDVAHEAGLKTAGIIWPATRNAKTLDWTVPDMAGNDAWERFGTRSWLSELRAAGLPVDHHGTWVSAPAGGVQRDWLYVRMARHVLMQHQPNLVLIHLIETDHVQHKFGPRSDDAYWAVSQADDRVRDLVEAAGASPLRGKTTIFICSDHGFFPIEKDIRPNVLLRQLGLIDGKGKDAKKSAWCLGQGGGCAVYVLDDARRDEIIKQLADQLGHAEGVDAVIKSEDFASIGQPTREQDPHAADLWLSAKKSYSFSDSLEGESIVVPRDSLAGTHGYLPEHNDLLGTCIIWGAGVKPGASLGKISNQDVAPTIAQLLGVAMPTAAGKSLAKGLAE